MTWNPRYIVQKAPGVGGTPIQQDEPCLVIRGQDVLAVDTLNDYIARYSAYPEHDPQVVTELLNHRDEIRDWWATHRPKLADR